jgi:ABC-type tungstate transport system permease subunit
VQHRPSVGIGETNAPHQLSAGRPGGRSVGRAPGPRRIAHAGATFLSRGDRSGTYVKEQELWNAAAIDPVGAAW